MASAIPHRPTVTFPMANCKRHNRYDIGYWLEGSTKLACLIAVIAIA